MNPYQQELAQLFQQLSTSYARLAELCQQGHFPGPSSSPPAAPTPANERPSADEQDDANGESTAAPLSWGPQDNPQPILDWLSSRNVDIHSYQPDDQALDTIGYFVGDRYSLVHELMAKLKRAAHRQGDIHLNLRSESEEKVSSVTQLCTELHTLSLLSEYRYKRSPVFQLFARPNDMHSARFFFQGGWLEGYVNKCFTSTLGSTPLPGLKYSILRNVEVTSPKGERGELDFLIQLGNEFIWVEAKTGDYQNYLPKYRRFAEQLGLPWTNMWVVVTDLRHEHAEKLSSIHQIRVMDHVQLTEAIHEYLKRYEAAADALLQEEGEAAAQRLAEQEETS